MKVTKLLILNMIFFSVLSSSLFAQIVLEATVSAIQSNPNAWNYKVAVLKGQLTGQGQNNNDFIFEDATGEMELQFNQDLPLPSRLNENITVYVDINVWTIFVNVNAHFFYYDSDGTTWVWEKTASQITSSINEMPVILKGRLTANLGNDNYTFTDATGSVTADFDQNNTPPNLNADATFYGVVDWYNQQLDVDIKSWISGITAIKEEGDFVVENYQLSQNFPNPFNPTTTIKFSIPESGEVTLEVYDLTGRLVSSLINEYLTAGSYAHIFDASGIPSGVYFYKISAGDYNQVRKMSLIK